MFRLLWWLSRFGVSDHTAAVSATTTILMVRCGRFYSTRTVNA